MVGTFQGRYFFKNCLITTMPTPEQCAATYHSGIGTLLTAAYRRDFTMHEQGKCKRKFPAFDDWYATLNADQRQRVDKVLIAEYGE